jgi:CheY-like chemotaxis protein
MVPTPSTGRALLTALVRTDGDLLVLRVGEKPFVRRAGVDLEVGTRPLPAGVVCAAFDALFPDAAKTALVATGRARCEVATADDFPGERFAAFAAQKTVLSVEIRRRRQRTQSARGGAPASPLVLLIDDSEDQIDFYALVLQDYYQVLQAGSGQEGLQMAAAAHPDVVVCDLAMPGLDGWEVCRRLAQDPATAAIPVIILTGTPDADLDAKAAAIGAAGLLRKPCPAETLRVHIDDLVMSPC